MSAAVAGLWQRMRGSSSSRCQDRVNIIHWPHLSCCSAAEPHACGTCIHASLHGGLHTHGCSHHTSLTLWFSVRNLCQSWRPALLQEEEHGDEEEKEGVLHEETFHRNPSLKLPEQPSRLQMAERTASHIWHRLPLLQVGAALDVALAGESLS